MEALVNSLSAQAEKVIRLELATTRSLWVVGKGDLKGTTFTLNPESEFSRKGEGW